MSERCPLGQGIYWLGENPAYNGVPLVCREVCEESMDEALRTQRPVVDIFTDDCEVQSPCQHYIEPHDYSLQREEASRRGYGVLNVCAVTGTELYSESVTFVCPNN